MSLEGKRALVTGGGTGIGRQVALSLAASGVDVTVCGRREGPLSDTCQQIAAAGGTARAHIADLMVAEDVDRLARLTLEAGMVDILVHNAGFSSKVRSARYVSADEWRKVMDVNTLGPVLLTQALIEPMREVGTGDIVMIASMAAIRPGVMAGAAYSAAKAAARAYMDVLSQEVRPLGIRCITVFPGEVDTPILDNRALVPNRDARSLMMQPEDIAEAVQMALSLPRRATVTEIALSATQPRDMSDDVRAAMNKKTPD